MDFLLLAFLAVPLVVALAGFGWYLRQETLDRQTRRYNLIRRFEPDPAGNYPVFYDPQSDTSFRPRPGNAQNYPVQNFLVANGEPKQVQRGKTDRPIVLNAPGATLVNPVQPEQLEQPRTWPEPRVQDVQDSSEPDFYALLEQAKQKGSSKTGAIESITGTKRGGSAAWRYWSEIWDGIQEGTQN